MNFGTILQALEAKQEKNENEFTMDDLLGLVVDLFNDVDRSLKNASIQGVEKLEDIFVEDEKRFVRNLCKLAMSFGRIYHNNLKYFSEDSITAIRSRAINELMDVHKAAIDLEDKLDDVNKKEKEIEAKRNELQKQNDELGKQLQNLEFLNCKIEQLEGLKCAYEDKLEKSRTIQNDINSYCEIRIPELDEEINRVKKEFDELEQIYSELQKSYDIEVKKTNDIRVLRKEKEKETENIREERNILQQQLCEEERKKQELEADTKCLRENVEKLGNDINNLKQQEQNIKKQIELITEKKTTLEDDVRNLKVNQNYLEAEREKIHSDYDRIKKEHDDIRHKAEELEEKRTELIQEIDSYKSQCESERKIIEDCNQEISCYEKQFECIKKEQEERRKDITEQKKRLEDAIIELFIYKINLERLFRNYQIQHEHLENKQMQIATQIKILLDDDVIKKEWMYSIDDLRMSLLNKSENMNEQIKKETKLFEKILMKLETDEIMEGYDE